MELGLKGASRVCRGEVDIVELGLEAARIVACVCVCVMDGVRSSDDADNAALAFHTIARCRCNLTDVMTSNVIQPGHAPCCLLLKAARPISHICMPADGMNRSFGLLFTRDSIYML